jgi:transmembrane sensor
MNKELLEKYCNNACTEEELSSVLDWFKESARTFEEIPDEESNPKINIDYILDKIHHKVNLAQTEEILEKTDQDLRKYKRSEHFIKILTRVAAILMFPVLGAGLFFSIKYYSSRSLQVSVNQAYNLVLSSVDAITKVSLPDGSSVWLNHSSSLKYPAMFLGKTRNVELTGEGYFEVVPNSKIPFIVTAGEIQIKALGTAFNIMAYPEEDRIETSLINGLVELERKKPNGDVIPLLKMKPTDLAIFQKSSNKIRTLTVNDDRYFSWKDGKLIFDNEPLDEVVRILSRWFNVDIQIKDPELCELTYTATFVNETLPQVMELMAMMSPVGYSISDREEISDGSFTRRKIVLTYRKN